VQQRRYVLVVIVAAVITVVMAVALTLGEERAEGEGRAEVYALYESEAVEVRQEDNTTVVWIDMERAAMAGKQYDDSKDEILGEMSLDSDRENVYIQVKLVSSRGGAPKIQMVRFDEDNDKFLKLGRVSIEEWKRIRGAVDTLMVDNEIEGVE
jgi:hypothetical protein